jgi:rhodanese-related sulfurtransferase
VTHAPGYLRLVNEVRAYVREHTLDEFLARLRAGEQVILLDVREESEWRAGRLPGAYHLGRGCLEREIERAVPDAAAPIVLYCEDGFRSVLSADSLRRMGYTNVATLAGGWRAWRARGLPVTMPEPAV